MHYAQERQRPSTRSIRDGGEGKGDERLPNSCCPVDLKSDGTTGQTTGHLEVDTPRATVPSLSTCDGHTTGHWPVALFKRRDR